MRLDKWYLDAVFPDGAVWYGYRARLRLGSWWSIPWASGCEVFPNGRMRTVGCFKVLAEPRLENGQWVWTGPDGFDARWVPQGSGLDTVLASERRLRVRWNCLAPRAAVTRILGGEIRNTSEGEASHGFGYVEHLEIETDGPGLPFRELWWGRAHAGESSLVWIRWGRGRELSLLLENGVRVKGGLETHSQGDVLVRTDFGEWKIVNGRPFCDRDARRSFPPWLVWLTRGLAPASEIKRTGPVRLRSVLGEVTGSGVWEEVGWA
jgi:hypothetical protein